MLSLPFPFFRFRHCLSNPNRRKGGNHADEEYVSVRQASKHTDGQGRSDHAQDVTVLERGTGKVTVLFGQRF